MEGRGCRWLHRTRRTCAGGCWWRWRRARRPARRFAVGRSAAHRRAREARAEGRRAAERTGGGPKPRITSEVEAALLDLLGEADHLTLAECRGRLPERTGARVHPRTVGRALRRRGWTWKGRS